jgi:8-amino-7-oxononanoate synthase
MWTKEAGHYFFETEITAHRGAWVESGGRRLLMLGSYQYLGLLEHPRVVQAAHEAAQQFGVGHHGSRLLTGTTSIHLQLESKLAELMASEAAIVFSSGYVANLSTISTLVGPGDCVIGDRWNHASIADGCRMSGAAFLEFEHNDMRSLEQQLDKAGGARTLVIVDTVFSMDGDIADLPRIVELCRRHGALLMVDEAHSLGVLGATGRGIQEHFGLAPDAIDVKMGTLSKALGGSGGFVAGREEIVTYLRHHARGYIFSGALPACEAAVALAAVQVLEQSPELVQRLWRNLDHYRAGLERLGFDCGKSATPIVPIMTGNDRTAVEMTQLCRTAGVFVIPVVFPAVPLNAPRLRTSLSAVHDEADLDIAIQVLADAGRRTGLLAT